MSVSDGKYSDLVGVFTRLQDAYRELEDQNKKLRECLEFYAEGDEELADDFEQMCSPLCETSLSITGSHNSACRSPYGKRARACLKELRGE